MAAQVLRRFNPNRPASEVYNHPLVKWLQDGVYFTGDKRPCKHLGPDIFEAVDPGNVPADVPTAKTLTEASLLQENAALRERLAALEKAMNPGPQPVGTAPMPVARPVDPAPHAAAPAAPATQSSSTAAPSTTNGAGLRAELEGMKTAQVKSIFAKKGGPAELAVGGGAQKRMIDWLVEHEAAA